MMKFAIELESRLRGCVCRYDVEHDARDHVTILHDAGCPAEHSGPGLVVIARGRWEQ